MRWYGLDYSGTRSSEQSNEIYGPHERRKDFYLRVFSFSRGSEFDLLYFMVNSKEGDILVL
jgi:hypothetical protein